VQRSCRKLSPLAAGEPLESARRVALEGNPLEDWRNIRRIKLRFKQGLEVH
jgi:hypothetical protein